MTMVTAERMDSLATSENEAARGVRIYDRKVGARLSPGGGERGEGVPLIGSAAALSKGFYESLAPGTTFTRIPPRTSKTL